MTSHDDHITQLFETWYTLEMPRLFRYVSYRVRDQATAEELTASICEEALRHLSKYHPEQGELNQWMYGIARNAVRMHYRSLSRQPETVAIDNLPEMRSPGKSLEQAYEVISVFQQAVVQLRKLTDQEQEIIALRYGAELSNQEIADVLALSPNTVAVTAHRALKRLKQLMTLEGTVG